MIRRNRSVQYFLSTTSVVALLLVGAVSLGCVAQSIQSSNNVQDQEASDSSSQVAVKKDSDKSTQGKVKVETASFGAGCFWCVEAVFQELDGVLTVKSGYMGGKTLNPTYKEVCTGTTGHAEICRIEFDPDRITFKELLEVFWKTHDPTTLNRQGADKGTQYRSAVFYHSDEQKELATKYKKRLNEENAFGKPVVTEIAQASKFYPAEDYHDNYFNRNPGQGYCQYVIQPKMAKFRKAFADKLKKSK